MTELSKLLARRDLLKGLEDRDFISILDLRSEELEMVLELALLFKTGIIPPAAQRLVAPGKNLALIFDKASLRTRVSFEVAIRNLGGQATYLAPADIRMGEREPVKDVARTLSRMVQVIAARLSSPALMAELMEWAAVPIINAMTDREHPCQALADLLTVKESKGRLADLKLAYIGDGFNVCHSLLLLCARMGMNIAVASPKGYEPLAEIIEQAKRTGVHSTVSVGNDPEAAVAGADVLVADVWISGGLEAETEKRRKDFAGYCLDKNKLARAHPEAIVLHCLPAHRGEEISEEILEGPRAKIFDEAENRLWAQQALLALTLGLPGEITG
jgi:ornithine carbamoyltransferase